MEHWETIAFAVSLLLLIISITIPVIGEKSGTVETTNVFTLLAMVLVGLTTPLSIIVERIHNISAFWIKSLYALAIFLFTAICISYFMDKHAYLEYPTVIFLGASVIGAMTLFQTTKPQKKVAHLEKINRIFAIAFLIIVPLSLLANYAFSESGYQLKVGFTLPLIFILLSLNKLIDDLQRLSLIKPKTEGNAQHFKNYGLSQREIEVAQLLIQGKTYKEISETLHISMPTVKTHSSNIYKKCKIKSRNELTLLLMN